MELWSDQRDLSLFGSDDFSPEYKSKRVKRSNSGWTQSGRYCTSPEGSRVRCYGGRYGLRDVTCPQGCDAADLGYDCNNQARGCSSALGCSVVVG